MVHLRARSAGIAALGLAISVAACDAPTAPKSRAPGASASVSASSSQSLMYCPSDTTLVVRETFRPGVPGSFSIGGTRIEVPGDAVAAPVQLVLTIPASQYMQVDIHANGFDHYVFQTPILVSIDYARCAGNLSAASTRSVWYIDNSTLNGLENMGGSDEPSSNRITFYTNHLSG